MENEAAPELAKGYEHREIEAHWYPFWLSRNLFHANEHDRDRPPFSIVLPPPNVTGSLHLGHALTATLQDILIRYKKMRGYNTLWLPGTDHAGIATQMVVEKEILKTEKKSRYDLGRDEFLSRVWSWKERFGSRIGEQHKALGASLDWERERFTMDAGLSRAVREVFVRLHEEGLIYREKKLINWCPRCHTALSDLEVNYEEAHPGELWSFAYPLADGSGEIVVATTRPETMLGDTAVAVHPEDERYRSVVGKKARHPLMDREIPIIGDAILVDPAFGTGAVKVTPAHDFNDFEVGRRHGLEMITVIGPDGRMTEAAGPVAGQDRFLARDAVKALLADRGLFRGTKPHLLPLARCQRCETVLEPLVSDQWYVRIAPLAKPAIEAVETGKTVFVPESWTNTYMSWMTNIHDWCISRQLWWGHQIPAWYCPDGHVTVARETPSACSTCGQPTLRQDEDVLDTWFSSALWPFSTMGWPDRTETLATFYPTSVMETGHDIIFFWVARMMMMGIHFMGEVPFKTVYLHPMVRDEKGQKMSKTKGNVIDPLVMTEEYGADALRFTLAALTAQGRDIRLSKDRIDGYRSFANKLWNATRFALMNLEGFTEGALLEALPLTSADRWIKARTQRAVNEATSALEAYRFNDAANILYQYVWHELCDWYIELAKEAFYGDDASKKRAAQGTLTTVLSMALRLLHPFMPFITEELWHALRAKVGADAWPESILSSSYPEIGSVDEEAERRFGPIIGIVDAIRNVRGEMNIPYKVALLDVEIGSLEAEAHATVREEQARIERLANVKVAILDEPGRAPGRRPASAVGVGTGFEVRIGLAGAIDVAAETARIDKEIQKLGADLDALSRKLENFAFLSRAPAEVVEKDRARANDLQEKKSKLTSHRAMLTSTAEETARRDSMENNDQTPVTPAPAAPGEPKENPMVQAAETAVAAATEMAKNGVTAVTEVIERVMAPKKPAKKSQAKPLKKMAKKAVAAKRAAPKKVAKAKAAPAKKVSKAKPAKKASRAAFAKKAPKAKPAKKLAKLKKKGKR